MIGDSFSRAGADLFLIYKDERFLGQVLALAPSLSIEGIDGAQNISEYQGLLVIGQAGKIDHNRLSTTNSGDLFAQVLGRLRKMPL